MSSEKSGNSQETPGVVLSEQQFNALTENVFTDDAVDPIYQAKAHILNDALQEIGMGKYQW
jgi:hypothetical protein